jgi:Tol biopolymer transport system component
MKTTAARPFGPVTRRTLLFLALVVFLLGAWHLAAHAQAPARRPMTFLDMQKMRQMGATAVSPDGRWLLYVVTTPDWKEARRQSDIYLVSLQQGLPSTRQMTFTKEKNETEPRWLRDGSAFVFASNREAPSTAATKNQLYLMRPDGGEARKITDAKDGVSTFALSRDGRWLVYRSGKAGEEQLYRLPVEGIDAATPEQLTKQAAGLGAWQWAPDGRRIYFVGPEKADADEKLRRDKKFTVDVRNPETPLASLWAIDLEPRKTTQLTGDATITVADFTISDDSKWVGFRGISANRYERGITEQNINSDPYLLEAATGTIERLLTNRGVGESALSFSPDGRWVAFSAPPARRPAQRPVWSRAGVAEGHLLLTRCGPGPQPPAVGAVATPHAMGWSLPRALLYGLSSRVDGCYHTAPSHLLAPTGLDSQRMTRASTLPPCGRRPTSPQ